MVDIADPLGNIGSFRMNHLHPPFNDVRARRAVLMAMSQEDYMRAVVGDDAKLWKPLPGFFTPGTPLYNEEGGEILKGPRNLDAAKKLLAESGYAGQPVTCLVAQDQPITKAQGDVTADLLKRLGMNVDFVATDWGTVGSAPRAEVAARPGRLADVPHLACRRGLHQSGGLYTRSAPMATRRGSAGRRARGRRRRSMAWFDAKNLDEEKAAISRLNKAALDNVVYAPTGFFLGYQAWRKNVTGVVKGPLPFFWGVSQDRMMPAKPIPHAELRPQAHPRHHPGDGGGGAVRVQPAVHRARRSGRGDRRRSGDAGRCRAHPPEPRASTGRSWSGSASGFWQILHGDLGTSIFTNLPVAAMIAQRIEPTLSLMVVTLVFTVVIAVPIGVVAAWKAGTWIDRAIMAFAVFGFSVPVFVVGYLLAYVFALQLEWLPVQGYTPFNQGLWPWFKNLILPAIALGCVYIALIARITRATMLEVLQQDYVRTARAKGLGQSRILFIHALKNAAVPIVTVIGIGIALLIGGAVVTESVFAIPGLGRLTVDAILRRDYPVIQGVVLLFSFVYVLVNLLVDLSYTLVLDPRIRY